MFSSRINSRNLLWLAFAGLTSFLVSAIPYALGSLWIHVFTGSTRADHMPGGSDYLDYWHEVIAFMAKPFHSGYFGYQEVHASLGGAGVHGIWLNSLYALWGKLFGWTALSPFYFNACCLSVGAFLFLALTKSGTRDMVRMVLFSAVFFMFCFSLDHFTPDAISFSISLILAGLTYRFLNHGKRDIDLVAMACVTMFAMLTRVSWAPMLLVIAVLYMARGRKIYWRYVFLLLVAIVALSTAYSLFASPVPFKDTLYAFGLFDFFSSKSWPIISKLLAYSFTSIFNVHSENYASNYFTLVFLSISFIMTAYFMYKKDYSRAAVSALPLFTSLVFALRHWFNGAIGVRHVAPHFFIPLFAICFFELKGFFTFFTIVNFVLYPPFLNFHRDILYSEFETNFTWKDIEKIRPLFTDNIDLSTCTENPWSCTVDIDEYTKMLLALPPRVAFNSIVPETYEGHVPLKARYLFIRHGLKTFMPLLGQEPRLIFTSPYGDLYENRSFDAKK